MLLRVFITMVIIFVLLGTPVEDAIQQTWKSLSLGIGFALVLVIAGLLCYAIYKGIIMLFSRKEA